MSGFRPAAAVKSAARRLPDPVRVRLRHVAQRANRLGELSDDQENLDRRRFFRYAFYALHYNKIAGDYAEFGSWSATTFRMAYDESRRWGYDCRMWAFDSFQGLPTSDPGVDDHPRWTQGNMATGLNEFYNLCGRHGMPRQAYEVVPGWYDSTLRPDASGPRPNDISLAYVDCDLYSSTRTVLEFLEPRLKHGMILVLDDYYSCTSALPSGERRAVFEVLGNHPTYRLIPYLRFGWSSLAFFVEDRRTLPGAISIADEVVPDLA
jgi:hypothetical protein